MDGIKREELEKVFKKKDHKVLARMVAARMVQVLNVSVEEDCQPSDTLAHVDPKNLKSVWSGLDSRNRDL